MSYSDAPIPSNPEAQFAIWRKYIDEQISRLVRPRVSKYVISITATTDTSGYITFMHDSQVIPQGIFIQPEADIAGANLFGMAICDSYTETTARVRCLRNDGSALVSLPVTFKAFVVVI